MVSNKHNISSGNVMVAVEQLGLNYWSNRIINYKNKCTQNFTKVFLFFFFFLLQIPVTVLCKYRCVWADLAPISTQLQNTEHWPSYYSPLIQLEDNEPDHNYVSHRHKSGVYCDRRLSVVLPLSNLVWELGVLNLSGLEKLKRE